jgi:uncharacterized protein YndB with AHSA1/START domain
MWEYEHGVETTAPSEVIWAHWTDVAASPEWNAGVERITIEGPFEAGTTFTMTPPGEEPIRMRLTEVIPNEIFIDEATATDIVVTTVHRLEAIGNGRTRITYRTEVTGPAADIIGPEIGPAITADFPDVLDALVARAEKQ